jgi:hypothetical protein
MLIPSIDDYTSDNIDILIQSFNEYNNEPDHKPCSWSEHILACYQVELDCINELNNIKQSI